MSTIKPIQATPELTGNDARALLKQVETRPTDEAIRRNNMLRDVLIEVRKK